jgi:hypothetical protein
LGTLQFFDVIKIRIKIFVAIKLYNIIHKSKKRGLITFYRTTVEYGKLEILKQKLLKKNFNQIIKEKNWKPLLHYLVIISELIEAEI